jgi:hypothetical protein
VIGNASSSLRSRIIGSQRASRSLRRCVPLHAPDSRICSVPDRQDPLAVVLAKFIIELAKQGERDPEKLCNAALKMLEK